MTKLTLLVMLICCTACRGAIQLETHQEQCHSDSSYNTLVIVAENGSGIDAILLGKTYLKPMKEPSLDLDFDFEISVNDSFTIYSNGRHRQIKALNKNLPAAILQMKGNTLQLNYLCDIPMYQ